MTLIQKIKEHTGLDYDKNEQALSGVYYGLPTVITVSSASGYAITARIFVSDKNNLELSSGIIAEKLRELRRSKTNFFNSFSYERFEIKAVGKISRSGDFEKIDAAFKDVSDFCRREGLTPCCSKCGEDVPAEYYSVNGDGKTLCSGCCDRLISELSSNETLRAEVRPDFAMGLLGTLAGGVVIFILTWLLFKLNFIVYIVGAVGVIVGMTLNNKLSGKLTKASAVLTLIFCLVTSVLTGFFCFANEMADISLTYYNEEAEAYNYMVEEYEWLLSCSEEELQSFKEDYGYTDEPREEIAYEFEEYINEWGAYLEEVEKETSVTYCMANYFEVADTFDNSSDWISGFFELAVISFISVLLGWAVSFKSLVNNAAGKFTVIKLKSES